MNNESLLDFRERLDSNTGLVSKRRILVTLSLLLLAIQFTGAVFKEANTFIFKIEFINQSGLSVFLLLAVVILMVRYYSYAHEYHQELFKLMAERMMSNIKYLDLTATLKTYQVCLETELVFLVVMNQDYKTPSTKLTVF